MPSNCIVLLVFSIFLVTINAAPQSNGPTLNAHAAPQSLAVNKNTVTLKPLLRSGDTANEDKRSEERAVISSIKKFADDVAIKLIEKMNTNPAKVFQAAHLDKAGVKLDVDNPEFVRWLRYVMKYRTKNGEYEFADAALFGVLENAKLSEDELAALFVSIRKVSGMKNFAESMMSKMSWSLPRHKLLNEAWLKSRTSPDDVFKILQLRHYIDVDNPTFLEWLRYTTMYTAKMGERSFSVLEFLSKIKRETFLAAFFQQIKTIDDLKPLAGNLQIQLFEKWLKGDTVCPKHVADDLTLFYGSVSVYEKRGPAFNTVEAFALRFALRHGGEDAMKDVKALFDKNNVLAALEAAEKTFSRTS